MAIKFTARENRALKLRPSRSRGKVDSVSFRRIIAVACDFATQGVRYKRLLYSLSRKSPTFRKPPIAPEMLPRLHQRLRHSWLGRRFGSVRDSLVIGLKSLPRGDEAISIMRHDSDISVGCEPPCITARAQFSKAGRSGLCAFRSLYGTPPPYVLWSVGGDMSS